MIGQDDHSGTARPTADESWEMADMERRLVDPTSGTPPTVLGNRILRPDAALPVWQVLANPPPGVMTAEQEAVLAGILARREEAERRIGTFACPECGRAWRRPFPMPDDDVSCPFCGHRDEARAFWPDGPERPGYLGSDGYYYRRPEQP